MKIFFILLIIYTSVFAAKIDDFAKEASYYRDYNTALKISKKENKIIMLVLVADFCPWCKKFERKTLEHKAIMELVDKNFTPIIVDNYRDTQNYPKKFTSSRLPTVYFIDSKTQKVLSKSSLYLKKNDFLKQMQKAIKKNKEDTR